VLAPLELFASAGVWIRALRVVVLTGAAASSRVLPQPAKNAAPTNTSAQIANPDLITPEPRAPIPASCGQLVNKLMSSKTHSDYALVTRPRARKRTMPEHSFPKLMFPERNLSVRSLSRRGRSMAHKSGGRAPQRRSLIAALFVAVVALLAFSVAASASTLTIPMPSGGTVTTGTDLPTASSAYNSAWQSAPTGYSAPAQDGLGVGSGQVGHVWVIVLENHAFNAGFTPLEGTQNTYEATLPSQGALLTNYYGTGHSSLDNYLSMVSGQAPLSDTQDDCPSYNAMSGSIDTSGTPATNSDYGQFMSAAGADAPPNDNGCVYPSSVKTIFNQLDSASKTWKVYSQDVDPSDNTPTTGQNAGIADCGAPESTVQAAPSSGSGGTYSVNDGSANATSQYVSKHNPLAWFDSILPASMGGTGGSDCSSNLVPLFGANDQLYSDLQSASTTPDFSYIVPNNCSNGHDAVCQGNNLSGMSAYPADNTSSTIPASINNTGGTYSESAFLSIVIPEIEASPAFKQNGLIVVDYDEAYPPFTYSNDSQANSQLQPADAYGSLLNDEAGETLYGRSLNWEPTGPNATIVTSPVGQVLTAGPGDSADIDRPTAADGALVACTEPTLDSGTDNWVNFTTPTSTNGACIPGFQANTMRASKTTPSLTIASGAATVPYTTATEAQEGESVAFNGTAPTLVDTDAALNSGGVYPGTVYVGSVADTASNPGSSSGVADTAQFTLVDNQGNPVDVSGGYTGTLTLTTGTDSASDPFYNAFDPTTGGGDSGAVLISPYITPGTVSNTYYNHYSLLRSLEDIFGISSGGVDNTAYLGFASQPGLAPFGSDVFTDVPGVTSDLTTTVTGPATTVTGPTQTVTGPTQTVTSPSTGTTTVTRTTTVTTVRAVVPYLVGDTLAQAKKELSAAGLDLGKVTTKAGKGATLVVSASPKAGTEVKEHTAVALTLAHQK